MNFCKGRHISAAALLCIFSSVMSCGCSSSSDLTVSPKTKLPTLEVFDEAEGIASFYHSKFHGRLTSNGEKYNKHLFTAAHRSYPFGTVVRVTRKETGKAVLVRINDRGPYKKNRLIDLSFAAAKELVMVKDGLTNVKIEVLSWGDENEFSGLIKD